MNSRIKNIYARLDQLDLDGLIVFNPANISYLTESISRDSYFLVSRKKNIYFTDFRYSEEIKQYLKGIANLQKINGSVFKLIADACLNLGLKRVGFEERYLPFAEYHSIKKESRERLNLIPSHSLIEELREVKDAQEIERIKKAAQITRTALKFIESFISSGKREVEVVAELERFIRYRGASGSAFNIIVASGANSAFPHHISSPRKLRENEPVLIDIGVEYQGYKSDLTRVFFLGKMNVLHRKIYDIVLNAQEKAISKIRPAESIGEIDNASRKYIADEGFGAFFGHNLGHGVGLEVHEEPHISGKENKKLKPGMVFTIEPAIYLPEKFGIRIEDMVLVTENGCEVLSGIIHK